MNLLKSRNENKKIASESLRRRYSNLGMLATLRRQQTLRAFETRQDHRLGSGGELRCCSLQLAENARYLCNEVVAADHREGTRAELRAVDGRRAFAVQDP